MIAVILAVLVGGYWIAQVAVPSARPGVTEAVTAPRQQASQAEIGLHGSAGLMEVRAGEASGPLLQATVPLLPGETLRKDVRADGATALVDLRTEGVVIFPNVSARDQGWDVAIAPETPLELRLDLGAGEIRVAGTKLSLQDLKVNLGVGKTEVELGPSVRTIEVSSGIGETTVVLPAGVAARVRVSVAIGDSDVPAGYVRDGEWYVSPGYNSASTHVEVRVNLAIGAIHIRQAP
jgi:hypothetical protein